MLKLNIIKNIPSKRHHTPSKLFDNDIDFNITKTNIIQRKKKLTLLGVINIKRIKKFHKNMHKMVSYFNSNSTISVVDSYIYNNKPYKLFLKTISAFGTINILPGLSHVNIGNILYYVQNTFDVLNIKKFFGIRTCLNSIPYGLNVCYLSNNTLNKWTYIKSAGTSGTKLKSTKKIKLTKIKLPSGKNYYFNGNVECFVGNCTNFFLNKLVEGSWGFSLKNKKKIRVRGVAMNPVDHPNGGRAKSKQPERSPWGWIAKFNK